MRSVVSPLSHYEVMIVASLGKRRGHQSIRLRPVTPFDILHVILLSDLKNAKWSRIATAYQLRISTAATNIRETAAG